MTLLEVGRVIRPHGLRGEVRVRLHWEGSDTLWHVERVAMRASSGPLQWCVVEAVRHGPQGPLLKLNGIDDRDAAEPLRGATLLVERSMLAALAPGEYYLADLVGLEVRCGEKVIGEVRSVRTHPTVDTIVIRSPDGAELEQVLVPPWLGEVLVERGLITLTSEDGLIT